VEILAWLVPAAVVTCVAMLWATWAGRPQRDERAARTSARDADHERFARAITREHPGARNPVPRPVRDRSTGIAVRPSRRTSGGGETRRSA
jgi:hypothetical protein